LRRRALSQRCPDPLFTETYDSIVGALNRLLVAAQDAGEIRGGLDPNDVILALARPVGN
jgi:hypothetical protein